MVRACRPRERALSSLKLARRSTTRTSISANVSSAASIIPVGPPPAIATACSARLVIGGTAVNDIASLVGALRVVMGEMDQPALRIPHIFAVDDHLIALFHRHAPGDRDVVFDLDRELSRRELDDELLMGAGAAAAVGQQSHDGAVGCHLNV